MNKHFITFLLLIAFLISGCAPEVPGTGKGIIPHNDFLEAVENSEFEDYASRINARVRDEHSFEAMQKHILLMYKGVKVTNSFLDESDNPIDCITTESQPSLQTPAMRDHKLATPPKAPQDIQQQGPETQQQGKTVRAQLGKNKYDRFRNPMYCAQGTIPMRRLTLETLTRFLDLDDFFGKQPVSLKEPTPGDDDTYTHYWAHAYQNVDNHGGDSRLNVWKPNADPGWFALEQHWYVGGTGNNKQTVEGGWQVAERKYSNKDPNLFIYYTSANYSSGSGCYNLDCTGFVQTNSSWVFGGKLQPVSTYGGTQYIMRMQWQLYEGNWWLFLQGAGDYIAVGYYPGSLYGTGQMSQYATRIDYGGEVSSLLGDDDTGQMGSGKKASNGWQQAAYLRTVYYIDRSQTSHWANLSAVQNTSSCYTVDLHNKTSSSWATYLYFGGPKCPNP